MHKVSQAFFVILAVTMLGAGVVAAQEAQAPATQEGQPPAAEAQKHKTPPARKIPAITVKDEFPRACVDCHIDHPEFKFDARLSSLMAKLQEKTPKELTDKARKAAPEGMSIKGRHPKFKEDVATLTIPTDCLECHAEHPKNKKKPGPPFARLLHVIHLTGGEENHFLTNYQGECTHCHKLNMETGQWKVGSGSEKK